MGKRQKKSGKRIFNYEEKSTSFLKNGGRMANSFTSREIY